MADNLNHIYQHKSYQNEYISYFELYLFIACFYSGGDTACQSGRRDSFNRSGIHTYSIIPADVYHCIYRIYRMDSNSDNATHEKEKPDFYNK